MTNERRGFIITFLLHFLIFGYPIQTMIPFAFGIDSSVTNIGFRILFLIISLVLIIQSPKSSNDKINLGWLSFIIFWIIYGIRLVFDLEIQNLVFLEQSSFYVYSFAFGVCLIPSVAVYLNAHYIDHNTSLRMMFTVLFLSNLFLAYILLSSNNWSLSQLLVSRIWVEIETNGQTKSIVNPITIGFFGEVLAIVSIYILAFSVFIENKLKIILILSTLLGIINLLIGASRGPVLFFLVLLVFIFYIVQRKKRRGGIISLKFLFLSILVSLLVISIGIIAVNSEEIEIFNRITQTVESRETGGKEERDYEWESAWRQFKKNPILGDAFITDYDHSYSHNLFLDVIMSTGFIGLFFFVRVLYAVLLVCRRIISNIEFQGSLLVYIIIFIAHFLSGMTSGGLFMSNGFWMLSALLLSINFQKANAYN